MHHPETVRVCFVCLGNLCRSPAAAAVFTGLATAAGLDVTVDSAGTTARYPGREPHEHAVAEATRRGLELQHQARRFTAGDFDRFDVVVALDSANLRDLTALAPDDAARAKLVLLRSLGADGAADLDVPDPWGRPPDAFVDMFDLLEVACGRLVDHVTRPVPPTEASA